MSEFGLKIKNIKAATLYYYNLGLRERYDYTNAMLCNSLFSNYMRRYGGLRDYKDTSTRDVICLDFSFGTRSYEEEHDHLLKLLKKETDNEKKERIQEHLKKVEKNEHLYRKTSKEQLREILYEEGITIAYPEETIHYKMLYRNPSKAKTGQVMFINEDLYETAHSWLTMDLATKMNKKNAKIVEISAYAPLSTSTIESDFQMKLEDVLILEDQDSFFKTMAKIVVDEVDENGKHSCKVKDAETEVKNTIWDGMALIETGICGDNINGMCLLRNHFFKACAFKTNIQLFIKDWCEKTGNDYNSLEIEDMFGIKHRAKDIKMITTDNAIKWLKFKDFMGDGTILDAYKYWKQKVEDNYNTWGIVKTDHKSKLGKVQQMSYQMINTLPCSEEDMSEITRTSVDYVELIRDNNDEFERYLRKNSNLINHYEMLADLQKKYPTIVNSDWFAGEKRDIINDYVKRLKKGKITLNADNMTMCGNPYALLLYMVGEKLEEDPTLNYEEGTIQVYCRRFDDGEYLCAFRNPHNSGNNICYFHNVYSPEMDKYFEFSNNICAVNCIKSDIQARANGMDFDSDFMYITNHPTLVKCAKICYEEFPTVVNELKESGITYENTPKAYATMDNNMAKAQLDIGESSNLAQLALSYYWTERAKGECADKKTLKDLDDNFVILAVLAQVAIDGCKREYAVKVRDEINRIRKMDCMKQENPFPEFMENIKEVKMTKNGKDRKYEDIKREKRQIKKRIGYEYICPMNWLLKIMNKIQGISLANKIDIANYVKDIKNGQVSQRQTTKLLDLIESYDKYTKRFFMQDEENRDYDEIMEETKQVLEKIKKIKISKRTMNYMIHAAFSDDDYLNKNTKKYKRYIKNRRKLLNFIYKSNPEEFLKNFINIKQIQCEDCGQNVIISFNNNKTCRCKDCQKEYRKKYKSQKQAEYREKVDIGDE